MKNNDKKYIGRDKAFTLLELLVVMAIIGILASISIPKFSEYRRRAFDTRALSDLRNIATAEEAYFMDQEKYLSCSDQSCTQLPGISGISKGVLVKVTANVDTFIAEAHHKSGTGNVYHWDSEHGGLLD